MTIKKLGIPTRIYGQLIPVAPDMNDVVQVVNQVVDAVNAGLATTNGLVGGMKLVQYRSSRLYGVPADALTLDRLAPESIVPDTLAYVQNPASRPLSNMLPPAAFIATVVAAGTADAVLVPAYVGAAAGDTVPITWQPWAAGGAPVASIHYDLPGAQADLTAQDLPTTGRPLAAIAGTWSGVGDTTVYVHILEADRFAPVGYFFNGLGQALLRKVDVAAGTVARLGSDEVDAYTTAESDALLAGKASDADLLTETQARQQLQAQLSKEVADRQQADVDLTNTLRDGAPTTADTFQKVYNLLQLRATQYNVATLAERNAKSVKVGDWVNVDDDGDGRWAIYRATSNGINASYNKISDPDLLNAAMTALQIKAAYESNPNTNALTNALLTKLNGIATGATANSSDAQLRDRSTHTGTQAMATVTGLAAALAGKLDVAAAWPDLSNETQIYAAYPNNKILSGFASVFDGNVSAALPESTDPYTKVAGLMYWRALSATTITFTKGMVDGATTLTLAAGETLFLLGQGGRSSADAIWYVRLRSSVNPAASGGSGASGIDYTKPVTLSQAATLQVNKAYTATGSGYLLTLPDPAANIGALLFVLIDKNATGFYPLAGTAYSLYARESLTLRAGANGWTKVGGELLPLGARIETSLSQQDAVGQNDFWRVPLSQLVRASVPALVNLPDSSLVVQRDCPNATLNVFVAIKNAVTNGYYVAFVRVTTPAGVVSYPVQSTVAVDRTGTGFLSQAFSLAVVAGTTLQLYFYNLDPANLRGQFDGSQCSLTYTETV